jgi:hypothetical protein
MTNPGAYISLGIVMTLGLFCGGCATGPQYLYTEQKDSASVGVGQTIPPVNTPYVGPLLSRPWSGFTTSPSPYAGSGNINIVKIDGLDAGFPSGPWGQMVDTFDDRRMLWDQAGKVWISPGRHTLAISMIADAGETDGQRNDGSIGPVSDWSESATGTIDAEFVANHMYRLISWEAFDVTLWDETNGMATRSKVGTWKFKGKLTSSNADTTSAPSP